jgi:amino acid transporter
MIPNYGGKAFGPLASEWFLKWLIVTPTPPNSFLSPGIMIPKSGGDYTYISKAFGPLTGFLYL